MFKFKFQKALDHYQDLEKQSENNMIKKTNEINEAESYIESLQSQLEKLKKEFQDILIGNMELKQIITYQCYIENKQQEIKQKLMEIENLYTEREELQEIYFERRKERKTFDTLKEQHLEKYKKEEEKKDQKIIDEITNNMYNRR